MNQPVRPWWARLAAWLPPLAHPVVLGGAGLVAVRIAGLRWHYFGGDLNGRPLIAMADGSYDISFRFHLTVLLALVLLWLLLWNFLPRWRRGVVWLMVPVFGLPVLLGQVDFEMIRLVGRRLSPTVINTYGANPLTSEILLPLRADLAHTVGSLALILGGWLWLVGVAWWSGRRPAATMARWSWWWFLVLTGITWWASRQSARLSRVEWATYRPPEVIFFKMWSGADATRPPPDMTPLVRRVLVPDGGQSWTNPLYPLMHDAVAPGTPPADPPDIILIAVESLRARHLGFINPAQAGVTPHLDGLARASVVFPRYIANGYPSAPGFLALHTGTLPHRTRIVTAEFTTTALEGFPARLRSRGYHTLAIWGGNVNMGNQYVWARQWYDEVDYQIAGNVPRFYHPRGDAETFRVLQDHLAKRDRESPGQPQFVFVATGGTHGPFTAAGAVFSHPEDAAEAAPFSTYPDKDRADNYDNMLRLFDRHLGRFMDYLATRPRARNTILILCGDHSVSITERVAYSVRNFPTDGAVWTTALVHGPAPLVGPPRTVEITASAVDIMPTVLAFAGDRGATAAMGADLFGPLPPEKRRAVAVREDGYRLDRDGWSLYVSAADPASYFAHRSFPDGELTTTSDPGSPFTAQDALDLHAAVQGWSWLIEQNRVWSPRAAAP